MKKLTVILLALTISLIIFGCSRENSTPLTPENTDESIISDNDSTDTINELEMMFKNTDYKDMYNSTTEADYAAAQKYLENCYTDKVLNLNGRTVINNTTLSPARFVGMITSFWPNGVMTTGSGYLVGSKHVLTAGHNVYMRSMGGYARAIIFIPGLNKDVFPFGSSDVDASRPPNAWINDSNKEADVSIIRLRRPLGYQVGWIATETWYLSDTSSRNARMNGYDADAWAHYKKPVQMTRAGIANALRAGITFRITNRYSANFYNYQGSSGGLLWRTASNGQPVAIGVNTDATGFGRSQGIRMTTSLIDFIRGFKQSYP